MFANVFSKRRIQRQNVIEKAVSPIVLENLEQRRLYSTYTYTVPSGHTAVYLKAVSGSPGEVEVHLDSASGTVGHTFTNAMGEDIIATSVSSFTFDDQVPAVDAPTSDGTNSGIEVEGGGSSTLEMDETNNSNDTEIDTGDSTSSSVTLSVDDATDGVTSTTSGTGLEYLTLLGDNDGGQTINVPDLTGGVHLSVNTQEGTYDTVNLGDGDSIGSQVTVVTGQGDDTVNLQYAGDGDDHTDALIDFGSGSGGGNTLNIDSDGVATLSYIGGTRTTPMNISQVNVTSDDSSHVGSLIVSSPTNIGDLDLESSSSASIQAALMATTLEVSYYASLSVQADSDIGDMTLYGTADFTATSSGSNIDTLDCDMGDSTLNLDTGSAGTISELDVNSNSTINAGDGADWTITTATVTNPLSIVLTSVADVNIDTCDIDNNLYVSNDDTGDGGVLTVGTFDGIDDSDGTVAVSDHTNMAVEDASTLYELDVTGTDASVLFQESGSQISNLSAYDGGLVTLQARADSPTSSGARILTVDYLYLGDTGSPSGTLDLKDNDLIVGPSVSFQFSDVQSLIADSYHNGAWDLPGISSSTAGANSSHNTALGYASVSELTSLGRSSVDGQSLSSFDSSTVIVKYTYKGDANLDGTVGLADFDTVENNYGSGGQDWAHGDFNYDGTVGLSDYNDVENNYGDSGL